MARIAIVGAGIAGMAAAARLSARGHHVTVFDAATVTGGTCGSLHGGGAVFDTGPVSLTVPAVFRDLFLKTGGPLEDSVTLLDVDEACRFHFADGTLLSLPGIGVARTTRAVSAALGQRAGERWARVIAAGAAQWASARSGMVQPRRVWARREHRSTAGRDARLRAVIAARSASWGGPLATALPYLDATFGVHHISGGIHTLAGALEQRCRDLGVAFELGVRVAEVTGSGTVDGIRLVDGRLSPCEVALVTDHSAHRHPQSTWSVGLATVPTPIDVGHHNVWVPPHGQRGIVTACVPHDDRMRPDGVQAWAVRVREGDPWAALATAGIDLRAHFTWQYTRTPPPQVSSLAVHVPRGLRGALRLSADRHLGDGLPLAALSAEAAAARIGPA